MDNEKWENNLHPTSVLMVTFYAGMGLAFTHGMQSILMGMVHQFTMEMQRQHPPETAVDDSVTEAQEDEWPSLLKED